MAADRVQNDSMDIKGNPVRSVYERIASTDINSQFTKSVCYYWVEQFRIEFISEKAGDIKKLYEAIKCCTAVVYLDTPEPSATITEETEQT